MKNNYVDDIVDSIDKVIKEINCDKDFNKEIDKILLEEMGLAVGDNYVHKKYGDSVVLTGIGHKYLEFKRGSSFDVLLVSVFLDNYRRK